MKQGLSAEDIRKLKVFTYKAVKKAGDEDMCSICLAQAVKGDRMYKLVCSHMFH